MQQRVDTGERAVKHMDWVRARAQLIPRGPLQKLMTRESTLDQLEVAITSLRAVIAAKQPAEVEPGPPRSVASPPPASRRA